ncbi:MAG: AGE family epimerase/isomerase, partial [Nitrospirota bacterium]|nr:AGE family epimerase/isomerase [Nitrospirota bacterium]
FISMEPEEIAGKTGTDIRTVIEIINLGKEKLLKERRNRESPFIDRTLYTSSNGMFISAYINAFKALKDEQLKDFALKSLERIMKKNLIHDELFHSDGVKALLDDYIYLTDALIAAYEVTGNPIYLHRADELMEICVEKFWDKDEGGFFDTEDSILEIRFKRIEDIPHPSANSLAILLLLKLHFMTSKEIYRQSAEASLKFYSLKAKTMDTHTGYYFCAMDAYFHMIKLTLETSPVSELTETVFSSFRPYVSIVYGENNGRVIPCLGDVCYEPVESPDKLLTFLKERETVKTNEVRVTESI